MVKATFIAGEEKPFDGQSVESAVALAAGSTATTRKTSSADRAAVLDRVSTSLAQRADLIAQSLEDESGYLTLFDMQLEVQRAIEVFTLTAAFARTGMSEALNVDAIDRARGAFGYVKREPIGPILGITAYNGPLLIPAHKIAPAIAAGAPIVIKPAPRVPRSAISLARLFVEAGWPKEAIAVLDVDNETTAALIRDQRLPVISFTGGEFGWKIKDMVPRKRVHLELGGVGAVFVAADANITLAARECAAGGFVRSGQSCISVQRIYVEQQRYEEFVRALKESVIAMQEGASGGAPIGPMVDESAAIRVQNLVEDAVQRGGSVACGGRRTGSYLEPTLVAGASADMSLMRMEAFGPVVAVATVSSIDEAISEINAVSGAIHHGIYTANIDAAFRFCEEVNAGGVIVNGPSTWRVDHMPYGGVGTSGFGREGVRFAVEEFTEPKVIIVRRSVR
ncbi:aldehyde dehydrogenase family protein [Bradyrhizobium sp. AS23.2]|uniref:aldehyde dehydrogenase family protein n=1 Tax=Bradyrhizobium sp. AS23.2 TaxID=1680155 RepID=UPI000939707A|nr:aldehyde dehydrogenase family protein [Bradyrhizobium sp. AS23.2]